MKSRAVENEPDQLRRRGRSLHGAWVVLPPIQQPGDLSSMSHFALAFRPSTFVRIGVTGSPLLSGDNWRSRCRSVHHHPTPGTGRFPLGAAADRVKLADVSGGRRRSAVNSWPDRPCLGRPEPVTIYSNLRW
jgi:hypothetical protein